MTSSISEADRLAWNNFNLYTSTTESVKEEIIEFQGKIPEWVQGTLYRNGPGQNEINGDPSTTFNHSFDGFAFIQKYNIDGTTQSVRFRGSFIKSRAYKESLKQGRLIVRQFGTDPCKSIFGRFQSIFSYRGPPTFTDDTGVTVQMVNNELLALTEAAVGNILDPNTLETVAPLTSLPYALPLKSQLMTITTAHVMRDEKRKMTVGYAGRITKEQHWLDVIFISDDSETTSNEDKTENDDKWLVDNNKYMCITTDMNERGKAYNRRINANTKLFRFPYEYVSYMHSASLTEDYLILTEIPLHYNLFYLLWAQVAGSSLGDMFKWNGASMPTQFRIISLDTGAEIARIPGPPFFAFHHINSYQTTENNKKIVVDVCAYDDKRVINELHLNQLRDNVFPSGAGYVRRFHLDLEANTCTEPFANTREGEGGHPISHANSLAPVQFELPRINPRYLGQPYRFVYGVRAPPDRWFDALIKIDVESKEQVALWEEPCTSPSEPIFVPRPDAKYGVDKEDDGVVLTVVLHQKAKRSFLLVLDGITFKELGRAYLPVHIPLSFHGNFY